MKVPEKIIFIKYNFLGILLAIFTGSGAFGNASNIAIICMMLYIVDVYKYKEKEQLKKDEDNIVSVSDI